jgi:hypothetical protein
MVLKPKEAPNGWCLYVPFVHPLELPCFLTDRADGAARKRDDIIAAWISRQKECMSEFASLMVVHAAGSTEGTHDPVGAAAAKKSVLIKCLRVELIQAVCNLSIENARAAASHRADTGVVHAAADS